MNRNTNEGERRKNEGTLEKMAQAVDPPSREISDDEIMDPGANIPREPMEKRDQGKPGEDRRH